MGLPHSNMGVINPFSFDWATGLNASGAYNYGAIIISPTSQNSSTQVGSSRGELGAVKLSSLYARKSLCSRIQWLI
jgi:hypothetical protein